MMDIATTVHRQKIGRSQMIRSLMSVARSASLAVLAGLTLVGAAGTAEAQHKWKVQNLYGPNTTVFKDFRAFAACA